MKYVPLLREEHFQSMAAVPILSRAAETIGVIVLHTKAPHEFAEDTLKLLVHIASLVSGAIENAQLYDQERRRVDTLTGLSELAQQVAAAPGAAELGPILVRGTHRLLHARGVPAVPARGRRRGAGAAGVGPRGPARSRDALRRRPDPGGARGSRGAAAAPRRCGRRCRPRTCW